MSDAPKPAMPLLVSRYLDSDEVGILDNENSIIIPLLHPKWEPSLKLLVHAANRLPALEAENARLEKSLERSEERNHIEWEKGWKAGVIAAQNAIRRGVSVDQAAPGDEKCPLD
jgi:hypothetical protein